MENGKIGEAKKRMRGIIADKANHFHAPYWAGIKPFQTKPPPDGRNSSFPGTDSDKKINPRPSYFDVQSTLIILSKAFAEYIGSNPGNSKMNHHWRTLYGQCAPCALEYEYITHLGTLLS